MTMGGFVTFAREQGPTTRVMKLPKPEAHEAYDVGLMHTSPSQTVTVEEVKPCKPGEGKKKCYKIVLKVKNHNK